MDDWNSQEIEDRVRKIWAEMLKAKEGKEDATFFELQPRLVDHPEQDILDHLAEGAHLARRLPSLRPTVPVTEISPFNDATVQRAADVPCHLVR